MLIRGAQGEGRMSTQPPSETQTHARPRTPAFQWVVVVLLSVIAAGLWLRPAGDPLPAAFAQNPSLAGARGVFAFAGQLAPDRFGLFMLDVDQGTIWIYELDNVGGSRKLRLAAARAWTYDRYLQDFNSASPDFREVQQLVAQQRARAGDRGATPEGGDSPVTERKDNKDKP
ncbi:hypothetical protein RAS1_21890 [Phycisphaerae bacterium RAS1]|nr:hypothetical protein RAS1_21890 [Phycisphaerae bacterium RAS1]